MDPTDHALRLTRDLLDSLDPNVDPRVTALALIGAGIMLLSESDPETAEALVDVLQFGAFRH